MKFLWFRKKNSYTEETINLFAKFGFELLKPGARDQLNKLSRNSNVLNLKNIKCHNNFDSTFNANKMNVLSLMLTRRLPIIGHRSTTSKQLVAPQCTSIKHGVHGKRTKDVSIDTQTSAVIPRKNMKTTWLVLQINTKVTVSDAFKVLQKDESLYYRFAWS